MNEAKDPNMWVLETPAPEANVRLHYGSEDLHFGDLRLPDGNGSHPVVIVIHGGFWRAKYDLAYFGHACADLTARGIATWNIEYRRIGNMGGGWPGTLQDVGRAADYLTTLAPRYNLDLNRVVALGHSAGGHLALWLAARARLAKNNPLHTSDPLRLRAAVSLAGVTNLRQGWELGLSNNVVEEFMGGAPDKFPERYAAASPQELLPLGVPQVLIHGTLDENVPFLLSEGYYRQASALGDPVELVTLPGAAHFEVVNPRATQWAQVVAAIEKFTS